MIKVKIHGEKLHKNKWWERWKGDTRNIKVNF